MNDTDRNVHHNAYRRRRIERFFALVDQIIAAKGTCHVLDLGGTPEFWLAHREIWAGRAVRFSVVNLHPEPSTDERITSLAGNACATGFADHSFDVVHSNSVIEHVGNWANMRAMAGEVRRLAPCYFVQTPAFWFPLEPHFRAPFFHWLPHPLRRAWVRTRPLGFFPKAASFDDAMRFLEDSTLLDAGQMRHLFPDATIEREKVLLLTKSFIALRAPGIAAG